MKGIVYQVFNQYVEDKLSDEAWEDALENTQLESKGIYTAVGTYKSKELFNLINYLCNKYDIEPNAAVYDFGKYLFPVLSKKYPIFVENQTNLKDFIKTIDDVIHVEVKKLYPEAELPKMKYEEPNEKSLILYYKSPRKLCSLALGLIDGAAEYFNTAVTAKHLECMLNGNEYCKIEFIFPD